MFRFANSFDNVLEGQISGDFIAVSKIAASLASSFSRIVRTLHDGNLFGGCNPSNKPIFIPFLVFGGTNKNLSDFY
jgi:hypothetical protein